MFAVTVVCWTVVLLLFSSVTGDPQLSTNPDVHIVGGEDAKLGEIPFQVSLQSKSKYGWHHYCGGSIVDHQWVITAAHCVVNMVRGSLRIVAGRIILNRTEEGDAVVSVDKIVHKNYTYCSFPRVILENDIALLHLQTPLRFNRNVQPIKLPHSGHRARGQVMVSGWGSTDQGSSSSSEVLQKVMINVVDDQDCQLTLGQKYQLPESVICAGVPEGGKDSCQGDSGGPLVGNDGVTLYLVGVVSWGVGCAIKAKPGVYTEVAYFIEWIREVINVK